MATGNQDALVRYAARVRKEAGKQPATAVWDALATIFPSTLTILWRQAHLSCDQVGDPTLPCSPRLAAHKLTDRPLPMVHGATGSDAASGDYDGQMRLASTRSADQPDVALLGEEGAAGKIIRASD